MSEINSTTQAEIREVPGAEGYGVDREGGTWSRHVRFGGVRKLTDTWVPLKQPLNSHRYPIVTIRFDDGTTKAVCVHVLMLRTFVGEKLPGQQTRHLDGNRSNNRLENLAWGTAWENSQDAKRHGTLTGTTNYHFPIKLTARKVRKVRALHRGGMSQNRISKMFGVTHQTICAIVNRRYWAHVED